MSFTLEAACASHVGLRRGHNEDNFYFFGRTMEEINPGTPKTLTVDQPLSQRVCAAVFDGMGGESYGEQASWSAAAAMGTWMSKPKGFFVSERKSLEKMTDFLNTAVAERAESLLADRMGTTMAALLFTGRKVYCCNVGDSRVFCLRDASLSQLSVDHVSQRPMPPGRKPPLTQHLGMKPDYAAIEPHIVSAGLQKGDMYLACSDGLTDLVSEAAITQTLLQSPGPESAADELVRQALENGGRDNITVIVCRIR